MSKLLKSIFNKETMMYLFFGILTTIVNFSSFILFDLWLGEDNYLVSNIISFVFATLFAFVTNKQFVFENRTWKLKIVMIEFGSFVMARIASFLLVEELGLLLAVEIFHVDKFNVFVLNGKLVVKILLAFVAVLINYVLSKFIIFKEKK